MPWHHPIVRAIRSCRRWCFDPQVQPQVGQALAARGHRFGDPYAVVGFKGGAQMLRLHRDGSGQVTSLEAGVDHRLDGVALGF